MEHLELTLPAALTAASAARSEVSRRFGATLAVGVLEDVRLLVTELITNAVRHGALASGAELVLKAGIEEDRVRVEVTHPGRNGPIVRREPGQGGGYGLFLVERLAERWGVERADGTLVWFELPAGGTLH